MVLNPVAAVLEQPDASLLTEAGAAFGGPIGQRAQFSRQRAVALLLQPLQPGVAVQAGDVLTRPDLQRGVAQQPGEFLELLGVLPAAGLQPVELAQGLPAVGVLPVALVAAQQQP